MQVQHKQYIFIDDLLSGNRRRIDIRASDTLIDPDIPLRFSLQNAFDGDPSTAFVANAENGMMGITIGGVLGLSVSPSRIAVINGCTRNAESYRNNNRIRTISLFLNRVINRIELKDDILSWQVIESDAMGVSMSVVEVFPGEVYNNTLITGLNWYSANYGWLFGDINE